MQSRTNNIKNAASKSAFFQYVKAYWWIPILGYAMIWGYFQIKKLIDTQKTKFGNTKLENDVKQNSAENNTQNPDIIKKKKEAITKIYPQITADKREALNTSAFIIAKKLGFHTTQVFDWGWGWFNSQITAMTEDEKGVIKELKKHPGTFPLLEQMYYKLYTHSRTLKADLLEYLSPADLKTIRAFYKKYGKTWL